MKILKHLDVFVICIFCFLLCIFVCLRIIAKEIVVDKCNAAFPGMNYLLYDLNTTVDLVEVGDQLGGNTPLSAFFKRLQHKMTAYTTSAMPFNQQINTLISRIDRALVNVPTTYSSIRYVSSPSQNVVDFANFLEGENIPFTYVSTPCRDSVLARLGRKELYENRISECSWYLLQNLKDANIDTIDLAQELADVEMLSYDMSNHWFPENALYAAKIVAEHLNSYGFNFDASHFEKENTWDYLADKQDWKKAVYDNCGYEFAFPIPNCATDMKFTLEHEGIIKEGKFEEALLQDYDDVIKNAPYNAAYHGCSALVNETLYTLYNSGKCNNANKRIVIIGDSFNWVLSSYLAIEIEHLDVIHNASFAQSTREYIKQVDPDMVLISYNDAEFVEIYTEQAYNFD